MSWREHRHFLERIISSVGVAAYQVSRDVSGVFEKGEFVAEVARRDNGK